MTASDDGDCVHDWQLVEAVFTLRGADQVHECSRCPAVSYAPGQAAVRDRRPPLDGAGATP